MGRNRSASGRTPIALETTRGHIATVGPPESPPNPCHRSSLFTSDRERRLWTLVVVVVATIYATLGLAGTLAQSMGNQDLNAVIFVLGAVLILAAIGTQGLRRHVGSIEVFVALGVGAIYVLVLTRLTSPVERSHLMEYGVVAILTYRALMERRRNGRHVPRPALLAAGATILIGAVDELIQAPLPNRVFDPVDIAFNSGAALLAVAASVALELARRKGRRSPGRP